MRHSVACASALLHLRARAEEAGPRARVRIAEILARAGEAEASVAELAQHLRAHAPITLNFHPDRVLADGRTVAEGLLHDGRYRSQFVTGVTSGSRTAFAGGERDRWEEQLFGGAYQEPNGRLEERPKYGALNLMDHGDGGSPRFGSCFLELRPHMTARCSFTWGDSHEGPEHVGTIDAFEPILAALLDSVETRGCALGAYGLDVRSLLAFRGGTRAQGRALDTYIEAQVHGELELSTDVARLVIDPSFDGTPTGASLDALCARHGIAQDRHAGFVLAPHEVPGDFRGPRMVPLAERVDRGFAQVRGRLDAAAVGRAAQSLQREPEAWKDWGTFEESLQHLKQLWHVLVQFGH